MCDVDEGYRCVEVCVWCESVVMSEVHVRGVVAMVIVVVCGEVMASLSLLLECSLRKLLIDIHDQPLFPEKVYQVSQQSFRCCHEEGTTQSSHQLHSTLHVIDWK